LHFRVSHYNEKVRWALDYKRVPHTREALVPGFHIPRVRWLTGQNKVPVLVLDGSPLKGSSHILTEIERRWPEPPLYPAGATERDRALAIERHFDEEVAPDLRRLFWSTYFDHPALCAKMATTGFSGTVRGIWRAGYPLMLPLFRRNMGADAERIRRAHERLQTHFDRLESEIGAGGYLVGDRFTMADLSAASVMTAIIRPPQFSYPLPEPWPRELVDLRASVSHRAGFRWVLDIYARHRGASSEIAPARAPRAEATA
jgi:glutathione S-transferase